MKISLLRAAAALAPLLALLASTSIPAMAAEAPRCKYVNVGELPLRFSGRGFQPVIDGSINRRPATMLLDTGSQLSVLTNPAVEKFELSQRVTGEHMVGIGGTSRLYSARVDEFGVGPIHSKSMRMGLIGDMGGTPAFDAIVGADFLFQADLELSFSERAVRFFRPLDCGADSFLAYWAKDAVVVPMTGGFGRSKNNTFTVELNGVKLDAFIDTGAQRTSVFERAARKAGVQTDHTSSRKAGNVVGIGTDIVAARSAVFTTFTLGGETIRDAELTILPDAAAFNRDADVVLGADYLRSHRVLFAMSQRQIYITYLGGEVFARDPLAIPAWLQLEADRGNPEALLALASRYAEGKLVARDMARAGALLEQAAAQEHRPSLLALASLKNGEKRYAEAAALLQRAVAIDPTDRRGWLTLYLARVRAGQQPLAATELEKQLAGDSKHAWPAPVGDFFLGRLDATALLAQADQDRDAPHGCDAKGWMMTLAGARGDTTLSTALAAERARDCPAGAAR